MTLQGHPRSLISAPIESPCMTSYSTSMVTLELSCRVSEILQHLYAESHFLRTPPLFGRKFKGIPLGVHPWRLGCKERTSHNPRLTDREIIFEEFQPMWSQFTNVTNGRTDRRTDGPTDRQTTCDRNTALCTKVHRAVKMKNCRCALSSEYLKLMQLYWNFFLKRITGDESWIHHYDPESKQQSMQWKYANSPSPRKFKVQSSAGKIMCSIFWDAEGMLLIDFMPQKVTITGVYYADLLHKLRLAIN